MLQVDVKNMLHIRKRFEGVHDSLKAISPSLSAAVQRVLQSAFREILDAEGIPKWVKLSPYTLREKQRLGYGGKRILQRTGRLRRSYSARSSDSQWRTTSASIIFENYLPYAVHHETEGAETSSAAYHQGDFRAKSRCAWYPRGNRDGDKGQKMMDTLICTQTLEMKIEALILKQCNKLLIDYKKPPANMLSDADDRDTAIATTITTDSMFKRVFEEEGTDVYPTGDDYPLSDTELADISDYRLIEVIRKEQITVFNLDEKMDLDIPESQRVVCRCSMSALL